MTEEQIRAVEGILKQRFGDRLSTSEPVRLQHAHQETWLTPEPADMVVFAQSTDDIQNVVETCASYKVPVIPYGVGSSLEGHVNAPFGGVSIDLTQMDDIIEVRPDDLLVKVQPGVTREQLNVHLRDQGLFFPIDPGANASLGGMAATRASGTNAVLYGTMRDNVVSMEAVMADGQIIRTASQAKKSSAGYDLTRLLIGSEGTLGVISELTLKLYGIPEAIMSGYCQFPDIESICHTVIAVIQYGLPVARIEMLDQLSVQISNQYSKLGLPEKPMLFVELHGSDQSVREQSETFSEIAQEFGCTAFNWSEKPEERTKLWQARHNMFPAIKSYRPAASALTTDACVPISKLADCVMETQADIDEYGLIAPIVGHVGDGNFHVAVLLDMDNRDEVAKTEQMIHRLSQRAIQMGGTCTGEHGIGQGKTKYMEMEHGAALQPMQAIKKALDPLNILNPGKIFPNQ